MIAVIFEVWTRPDRREDYFAMAAALRPELEATDGFISIERFASLAEEGKILSLSFWRDEEAVRRWRQNLHHREAQQAGRDAIFRDYRLRVVTVLRDYGMNERTEAPLGSVGGP